ncbi:type III secretion system chaperone [Pseudovibrio ascidiaceicola]|uniref:type III secretion system chaperone n=1 Tax=Pseudovibrio ascidiaceicola TaxID=285279 RepID=UPI000D6957E7|nr:type III secretion system chaperone [Pseudovibrio ascidiaceicola]
MGNFKIIHDLMVEVGPLLEALEISEYAEAKTWTVLLEDFLIILESDEDNNILHISTILASPAPEARRDTYLSALRYSGEQQAEDNYRVGLVEKDGDLALIKTEYTSNLDRNKLYTTLKDFLSEASKLNLMIETSPGPQISLTENAGEIILPA